MTDYSPEQDPLIARQVTGTVGVPSYLTGDGGPGSRLHYGPAGGAGTPPTPDALPTPSGATVAADFVCNIPRSASAARPAHLSLYGHGLLGRPTEINAGNVRTMSNTHNFTFCATSWIGMAAADVPFVAGVLHRPQRLPRGGGPVAAELPELPLPGPRDDPPGRVRGHTRRSGTPPPGR